MQTALVCDRFDKNIDVFHQQKAGHGSSGPDLHGDDFLRHGTEVEQRCTARVMVHVILTEWRGNMGETSTNFLYFITKLSSRL